MDYLSLLLMVSLQFNYEHGNGITVLKQTAVNTTGRQTNSSIEFETLLIFGRQSLIQ